MSAADDRPIVGIPDSRTLWCSTCRRSHPLPVCGECGRELPDLPHRLLWMCEPCKSAARASRENRSHE
jgi:hypothetical protein